MSTKKNAGVVTAYGAAVQAGYEGSYEDFCAAMADLGIQVGYLKNMTVTVNILTPSSSASASYANGVLTLNIPRGNKGDKGNTGETPNLTIGTVTTGEPGSSAAATITGTAENPVLNLTIPEGEKGDTGNPGEVPAAAIAGTQASTTASKALAVGEHFWLNGTLYTATSPIASGGTIVTTGSGKNCELAVIGDELASQSEKITELKTAFTHTINDIGYGETSYTFIQGYRTTGNPYSVTPSDVRITTDYVISAKAGDVISVSGTFVGLKFVINGYLGTTDYNSGWKTDSFDLTVTKDGIYFVGVAKSNGTDNIVPADATTIIVKKINHTADGVVALPLAESAYEKSNILEVDVNGIKNFEGAKFSGWQQGAAYRETGGTKIVQNDLATRCKLLMTEKQPSIKKVIAKDGYNIVVWACTKTGSDYYVYWASNNGTFTTGEVDVSEYSTDYYLVLYVSKTNTSANISTEEATANILYIADFGVNLNNVINTAVNGKSTKEISVLFVGNSLTQDGIAYLPYLFKTYYPEISFKIYMWYNAGYTLAQQYTDFVNDNPCDIFSVAENATAWTNFTDSKTMASILSAYTFDIVSIQEYFNYKETYTEADLADWNNCKDYITSHYTGGNGLEFITLFHAPLRSDATNVFNLTKNGINLTLQKTICDDMIPNGIAVYRALSTDLDDLGDQGHLSPDGTHTQEGLPCLLQTYVTMCWFFDRIGLARSVYGCPMRMTTDIYNTLNVPGANLGTGVITGTDAQNLLAQEVAIKAYKEGKSYVENNIFAP